MTLFERLLSEDEKTVLLYRRAGITVGPEGGVTKDKASWEDIAKLIGCTPHEANFTYRRAVRKVRKFAERTPARQLCPPVGSGADADGILFSLMGPWYAHTFKQSTYNKLTHQELIYLNRWEFGKCWDTL